VLQQHSGSGDTLPILHLGGDAGRGDGILKQNLTPALSPLSPSPKREGARDALEESTFHLRAHMLLR
jgi:hypothetical protein